MKTGIFALACTATLLLASCKDKPADTVTEETTVEETAPQPADITEKQCFLQVTEGKAEYANNKTLHDSIIFEMERKGDSIWGIFHWKPQEKDKKIASYKGTISGTTGTVIANSHAEGMNYNEEVIFTLTDSAVAIKYGEMAEGKDGIWHYKDKNNTSEQVLTKVECK
jgi:hypothetical protein